MVDSIPILLISFNRPEKTMGAIENIKLFKPKKVYFSVDGPREKNDIDIVNVKLCQQLSKKIDWDCKIVEIFSNINYGSGEWPYRSISNVLLREKYLLIIEDDVRISPDFYKVLLDLMPRYESSSEIFAICASNIVETENFHNNEDYFFTKYFSGWGWATWANAWQGYEFVIAKENRASFWIMLKGNNFNFLISLYFYINLLLIKKNKLRAWDYQINNLIFKKRLLNIKMTKNMSTNVGVGVSATHTKFMPKLEIAAVNIRNLNHPPDIVTHNTEERMWRKKRLIFLIKSWMKRILQK